MGDPMTLSPSLSDDGDERIRLLLQSSVLSLKQVDELVGYLAKTSSEPQSHQPSFPDQSHSCRVQTLKQVLPILLSVLSPKCIAAKHLDPKKQRQITAIKQKLDPLLAQILLGSSPMVVPDPDLASAEESLAATKTPGLIKMFLGDKKKRAPGSSIPAKPFQEPSGRSLTKDDIPTILNHVPKALEPFSYLTIDQRLSLVVFSQLPGWITTLNSSSHQEELLKQQTVLHHHHHCDLSQNHDHHDLSVAYTRRNISSNLTAGPGLPPHSTGVLMNDVLSTSPDRHEPNLSSLFSFESSSSLSLPSVSDPLIESEGALLDQSLNSNAEFSVEDFEPKLLYSDTHSLVSSSSFSISPSSSIDESTKSNPHFPHHLGVSLLRYAERIFEQAGSPVPSTLSQTGSRKSLFDSSFITSPSAATSSMSLGSLGTSHAEVPGLGNKTILLDDLALITSLKSIAAFVPHYFHHQHLVNLLKSPLKPSHRSQDVSSLSPAILTFEGQQEVAKTSVTPESASFFDEEGGESCMEPNAASAAADFIHDSRFQSEMEEMQHQLEQLPRKIALLEEKWSQNGALSLALLDISFRLRKYFRFINVHRQVQAFFCKTLPCFYSNLQIATETFRFCISNRHLFKEYGLSLSSFYPSLLKLYCWFPRALLPQINSLLPYLIAPDSFLSLFGSMLDIPLTCYMMEFSLAGDGMSLTEDTFDERTRTLFHILMATESSVFINIWDQSEHLQIPSLCARSIISPRMWRVMQTLPELLSTFFSSVSSKISDQQLVLLLVEVFTRYSQLYPLPAFRSMVQSALRDALIKIFAGNHALPRLIKDHLLSLVSMKTEITLLSTALWLLGEHSGYLDVKEAVSIFDSLEDFTSLFVEEAERGNLPRLFSHSLPNPVTLQPRDPFQLVKTATSLPPSASSCPPSSPQVSSITWSHLLLDFHKPSHSESNSDQPFLYPETHLSSLRSRKSLENADLDLSSSGVLMTEVLLVLLGSLTKIASLRVQLSQRALKAISGILCCERQLFHSSVFQLCEEHMGLLRYPGIASMVFEKDEPHYKRGEIMIGLQKLITGQFLDSEPPFTFTLSDCR